MLPLSPNLLAVVVLAWGVADWLLCFRLVGGEHAGAAFTLLLLLGCAAAGWLFVPRDGVPPEPGDPNID